MLTALRRLPRPVAEIGRFIHGATVAINTVVQRKGARVGLITTFGFRDVLELGRGDPSEATDLWGVTSSDGDAAVDDESTRRAREITPRG